MEIYNDLLNVAKQRRAIKEYNKDEKINEDLIRKIHEFTNTAPTSVGLEQWRVLSISNKNLKEDISKGFQNSNIRKVNDCSHLQLFISKKREYFNVNNKHLLNTFLRNIRNNNKSLGKETDKKKVKKTLESLLSKDIGNNHHNYDEWSIRQAYIALGYMMIGAQSLNISSTPMEGFNKDELNNILINKGMINQHETVSIALSLGYINNVKVPFFSKNQNRSKIEDKFTSYKIKKQ